MDQTWTHASGLNYGGVWVCFKAAEAHPAWAGAGFVSLKNGGSESTLSLQNHIWDTRSSTVREIQNTGLINAQI